MALRKLGYSGNTQDPKQIEAAYEELKKLKVIHPENPALFWPDNLQRRASLARHPGGAIPDHALLRPDVAAKVAETIGYPTPNLAARKLLPPEVASDPSLRIRRDRQVIHPENPALFWPDNLQRRASLARHPGGAIPDRWRKPSVIRRPTWRQESCCRPRWPAIRHSIRRLK
jgi:spermidine/putrescine-binding protein